MARGINPALGTSTFRLTSTHPGSNPFTPPVPAPTTDVNNLRACVEALKAGVESLTGQRGDAANRAVTFRDLIGYGVLNPAAAQSPNGSVPPVNLGTVTSITAGTGLTGGTITLAGTIALDIPVSVANGGTGATTVAGSPFLPLTGGVLAAPGNLTVNGTTSLAAATATTPPTADNSIKVATTAFVKAQGYTSNLGTVTSITAGTGLTGGTITGTGTIALSVPVSVANGGTGATTVAGSPYLPLTGGTLSGGLHFGSALAPGGATDTSRHLTLYDTGYGLNATSGTLNLVAGGTAHSFTSGGATINGGLTVTNGAQVNGAPVIVTAVGNGGQFRMVNGNTTSGYGSFWRNDSASTYLLLTNVNDAFGTWNGLRPFTCNNASGVVSIGQGLIVSLGGVTLANQTWVYGVDTGGTPITLLTMWSDNNCYLCDTSHVLNLRGSTVNLNGPVVTSGNIFPGQNIFLNNQMAIYGKDTTGNNRPLIYIDSSNLCNISDDLRNIYVRGTMYPSAANAYYLGVSSNYWYQIFTGAGGYQTGSDRRMKTDIEDLPDCLDLVRGIALQRFRWKDGPDTTRTHWGFIAQDVGEVMGEDFAGYTPADPDEPESIAALNYNQLVAVLWKACQELLTRVEQLEAA